MKEHVIINKDRTVTVPDSLKKLGIQFDHNVNTIVFDCPRYADEDQTVDMSQMRIFINYMLPDKTPGSSPAENVVIDPDDENLMHFNWRITNAVTPVNGVLSTLICVPVPVITTLVLSVGAVVPEYIILIEPSPFILIIRQ